MGKLGIFRGIRRKAGKAISAFGCILSYRRLANAKKYQKLIFDKLCKSFSDKYNNIKHAGNIEELVTLQWKTFNSAAEKSLLPCPSFAFLKNSIVARTMFVSSGDKWLKKELSFLEEKITEEQLRVLLQEDLVGKPILMNRKYMTSHNSIHHLYSIAKFLDCTHCDLEQVNTIVEWGGGYGNMAKLFKRLKSESMTYVIIDTPMFCCVQWLYLTTILGKDAVNLIQNAEDRVISGKINILPINFVSCYNIDADFFVSTWALSESSKYSQDFVINNNFFNAKHILAAWHENTENFPDSDRIAQPIAKLGAKLEDIEFLPDNYYAFR